MFSLSFENALHCSLLHVVYTYIAIVIKIFYIAKYKNIFIYSKLLLCCVVSAASLKILDGISCSIKNMLLIYAAVDLLLNIVVIMYFTLQKVKSINFGLCCEYIYRTTCEQMNLCRLLLTQALRTGP